MTEKIWYQLAHSRCEGMILTSVSLGAIVLHVAEDLVGLVRVERRDASMGNVSHPESCPNGRDRGEDKMEHLHGDQNRERLGR